MSVGNFIRGGKLRWCDLRWICSVFKGADKAAGGNRTTSCHLDMNSMTAATENDTNDEKSTSFSRPDFTKFPPRVIATEGYERLFGHFTGVLDTMLYTSICLTFRPKH